jgi:hypothetical protein
MNAQLDLFDTTPAAGDNHVGLAVWMPTPCLRCGCHSATIGTGRGPHRASIMCVCGHFRSWMSAAVFDSITATIRRSGRPSEPIRINR